VNIKWKNNFKSRYSLLIGVENNYYLTDYPTLKCSLGFTLIRINNCINKQFRVLIIIIILIVLIKYLKSRPKSKPLIYHIILDCIGF
jgi:hypothetical protein